MDSRKFTTEPVAIVGSSCRFPGGASSPARLWDLLEQPRDIVKEIPEDRFSTQGFYHEDGEHHGSSNVKHAYLLDEDHRVFDHNFFNISPREAETMDPQMRILLETVYEGVESSGYSLQQLRGSDTAVFVGMMNSDYMHQLYRDLDSLPQYAATGMTMSIMANRLSYFFDWHGPSVAIDTACSSSMVGLHQAVQALRNGEVRVAVAAGTNIILGPEVFIAESKLHMLSPNGRSYMWDASADGYTRGEGIGSVVLKKLSQAIADGDHIESIIRETGINQDGRTPGITMPSAEAQAALIRSTYSRAGLDLQDPRDRPQFFEAHRTGTPAGDPIEAEAIHRAFFSTNTYHTEHEKLPVGSIKTVVGHLEGTAGLAGVIKASLAVQRGVLPPNLHFNQLNPKIRPFYDQLYIPMAPAPWPSLPERVPRRVSVNSFGFGGTNGHAIIESWPQRSSVHCAANDAQEKASAFGAGPFVLSAHSNQALISMARALSSHLKAHPDTDLRDLAYTLSRRSEFSFRASFSATSTAQLSERLDSFTGASSRALTISETLPPRILGVFTGQGAQWPAMGKELYSASCVYRDSINQMQKSLDELPEPPTWSLVEQLSAPSQTSRVHEAAISQPLCTAIQVALVDVLRAAGVSFSAVVGHSSGEIGAAYAAGYLDASDAIRIAYYRGVYAKLAQGPQGQRGKMMAVGLSLEQANAFCSDLDISLGNICVAASNSRLSCTLAGDADAIDEAQRQLEARGTFARLLKVDTAYHSHHMQPCAAPYLESMRRCKVAVQDGPRHCAWYSSVYGSDGRWRTFDTGGVLTGEYWVANMTQPVMFSQAVQRAVAGEHCHDLVLEIGPHPSLQGPTSEMIKTLTSRTLPYSGVLKRGASSLESLAGALGIVWEKFLSPRPVISFQGILDSFLGHSTKTRPRLIKGLPTYSWDHEKVMWRESRQSKLFRSRKEAGHELLGHCVSHGERDKREMRWRQVMKVNEMPWTRGHVFQGQVLFPAAGYLAMAHEAVLRLVDPGQPLRLVELHHLEIHRAMTLEENATGTDVTFTVRVVAHNDDCITAEYACYSANVDATDQDGGDLANFTGRADLLLGPPAADALPPRIGPALPMEPLDVDQLYSNLSGIGLEYSGDFRAQSIRRRLHQATVTVERPATPSPFHIHPATLDAAVHGLFAGFTFPGDGRLWTAYLPTTIDRVRINNMTCPKHAAPSGLVTADTTITRGDDKNIVCDVDVFCAADDHPEVQIRGLTLKTFASPQPRDDRRLYAQHQWVRDTAYGIEPSRRVVPDADSKALSQVYVRTAYFYLRRVSEEVGSAELSGMAWHHRHLINFVRQYLTPQVQAGTYPDVLEEWANDTADMLAEWRAQYPSAIDLQLANAVGENLLDIVRGTIPPLQVMMQDGMLDRLYTEGLGFRQANEDLAVLAGQLAQRYPRMRVLEIGAGTGGATSNVLPAMMGRFASYTYTDISPGFFERARAVFSQYADRMIFKTLNVEREPSGQGFEDGSFDLIIASNVLHATGRLEDTMSNCRRLLRPGGHIMLLEITREFLPAQLIMGTLPGWFLGIDDGRVWAPTISEDRWDSVLKKTGFSGVDTSATSFFSVMVSQAVDDAAKTLREPLAPGNAVPPVDHLVIIGGGTPSSASLVAKAHNLLQPIVSTITCIPSLDDIKGKGVKIPHGAAVLSLCDLDSAAFNHMDEDRFQSLQEIIRNNVSSVLWVTRGAVSGDDPVANMVVGWGRCVSNESPDTKLQFLDLDRHESADPAMLSEMLLRLVCAGRAEFEHVLWTVEQELAFKDGAVYLPRVWQNELLNQRYNSERRPIDIPCSIPEMESGIEIDDHSGSLQLQQSRSRKTAKGKLTRVQVTMSSACALTCSDSHPMFLVAGLIEGSGEGVLGLSPSRLNCSLVGIPEVDIFHWPHSGAQDEDELFHHVLTGLLAESVLSGAKGLTWVHGGDSSLAQAIHNAAEQHKMPMFFSTTDAASAGQARHFVHPYISGRDLEMIRPAEVGTFINIQQPVDPALDRTIRSSLPDTTTLLPGPRITPKNQVPLPCTLSVLSNLIKQRLDAMQGTPRKLLSKPEQNSVVSLDEVPSMEASRLRPSTVVDWRSVDTIQVKAHPLRYDEIFSANKTYLLIGLSGDLGLSIAEWMVDHGARYVVVSSRNPKVPQAIIDHLARKRAILRVMALDISNRDDLHRVYNDIQANMPPIGGVMNGAMVLRDGSFTNMGWDEFSSVLAPKVQGSQYLDEIFHDDKDLEFMIFFSSLASIVGNAGQSAYATANLFMTSLANQRRRRGVPASVLYVGMVMGVGYVHHAESRAQYEVQLRRNGCMAISETDLHDMMAAAILCGRPGSTHPADLITGLEKVSTAAWRDNPRFALDFSGEEDQESGMQASEQQQQGRNGAESVASQLAAAKDEDEALEIVLQCFVRALGRILQISEDQLDVNVSPASVGIDSLVAVQVRSWFLKEMGADIPVLKILGDNTVIQLCKDALAARRRGAQAQDQDGAAGAPAASLIDWEQEISALLGEISKIVPGDVADSFTSTALNGKTNGDGPGLRVVLTGATGFLGTSILRKLVADERVSEVHCVAIRPDAKGNPRRVKLQDPKISEYSGELTAPLLGLSSADFARLSRHADVIIHNGAEVRFLQSYGALRPANVGSTQALLAMATPRRLPLHFVSTGAVSLFLDGGETELPEVSAAPFPPPADIETENRSRMGYSASKWASEVLLERCSGDVPAVVHRAVAVLGPEAPATDLMSAIERYSTRLGAVPALDGSLWPGRLDRVDVEDVAGGIVASALATSDKKSSPQAFTVCNYCTNDTFGVDDLQRFYSGKTGQEIALWPVHKWLEGAAALGMNKVLEFFIRDTYESKKLYKIPSLRKGTV